MKKFLALFLALTMVLALFAGCSGKEDDIAGQITPVESEKETTSQITPVETDPPEEVTEEVTEAPEEVTEAVEEENAGSLGRIEGGVYTNTYAGFSCTLDSNWVYYSADELQQLPANTQELFAETELGELTSGYTQISDMMAENATDLATMNVLYTQIGLSERLVYMTMTEEEIIDQTLTQKDMMVAAYEQSGMENISIEKVTVSFLGEEHTALKTAATVQGVDYYILQVFNYHLGSYGVTLTVNSYIEDNTQALLDMFTKV